MLEQYYDLMANVRGDGQYHRIRQLVQPNDPEVIGISIILQSAPDPVAAAQDFVHSFTEYQDEDPDYWETPEETLAAEAADCDGKAILLCSILRNWYPPEEVFCAVGTWGKGGHMWVVMDGESEWDRIIEATTHSRRNVRDNYHLMAIFNDQYAFATRQGLREFHLIPVGEGVLVS